jgi:hypothetical protein
MKLTCVTITGADESVDPYNLCHLYDDFPFVEWGILMSVSKEGKEARYPSESWVDELLRRSHGLPLAAHLCGQFSRDAIDGPFLWAIERPTHFERFGRIQFNGSVRSHGALLRVGRYEKHFPSKEFIFQSDSFEQCPLWLSGEGRPSLLLDNSGGRGVQLTEFPAPVPGVPCGYSGGIGPHSIDHVCRELTSNPNPAEVWIDTESNVRSDVSGKSVFDLVKVRKCLEIASKYVAVMPPG